MREWGESGANQRESARIRRESDANQTRICVTYWLRVGVLIRDAEEPGSKHDLKGKGATREMATSGFSYEKCKGNAKCVLMRLARTYSSRGPDRTLKGPH